MPRGAVAEGRYAKAYRAACHAVSDGEAFRLKDWIEARPQLVPPQVSAAYRRLATLERLKVKRTCSGQCAYMPAASDLLVFWCVLNSGLCSSPHYFAARDLQCLPKNGRTQTTYTTRHPLSTPHPKPFVATSPVFIHHLGLESGITTTSRRGW